MSTPTSAPTSTSTSAPAPTNAPRARCTGSCPLSQSGDESAGKSACHTWFGRAFLMLFVLVSIVELFGTWTPAQKHLLVAIQVALLVYAAIVVGLFAVRAYRALNHIPKT
jgi:hypothetical protein